MIHFIGSASTIFLSPFIGSLSDNSKSKKINLNNKLIKNPKYTGRFGKRKPFVLIGSVVCSVFLLLMVIFLISRFYINRNLKRLSQQKKKILFLLYFFIGWQVQVTNIFIKNFFKNFRHKGMLIAQSPYNAIIPDIVPKSQYGKNIGKIQK